MSIGRVPGVTGIQPSIVDAKGDLIVATAADSVDRLAVGTNGHILVADSTTSTGLAYRGFSGCRVQKQANQTLTNASTYYSITFEGTEDYDTDNYHSTSTNTSRITVPRTGYYFFSTQWAGADTLIRDYRYLKNGTTEIQRGYNAYLGTNLHGFGPSLVGIFYLVANDYVEFQMSSVGNGSVVYGSNAVGAFNTLMTCVYLGA